MCSQSLTTPWSIEFNVKRLQLTTPWSIEFNENVLVLVLGNLLEVLSDQSLKKIKPVSKTVLGGFIFNGKTSL